MSNASLRKLAFVGFLSLLTVVVQGQEKLINLFSNPLLIEHPVQRASSVIVSDTILRLPFFEDFSVNTLRPDTGKWEDNFIFVNKDFPINPPNTGAATFDVLDANGKLYGISSSVPFIADMLTSRAIRLDSVFQPQPAALGQADSVYFSFWYQPQGRGDQPEAEDSLVLQFGFLTGQMVFDHIAYSDVWADDYLLAMGVEQINPLDTLSPPEGCNPNLIFISDRVYTWGDLIQIPCDSVFVPEQKWQNVWSVPGMLFNAFREQYGSDFKQVMIPIIENHFFNPGFKVRFFNYGSVSGTYQEAGGNVDQWNVDFIYLNRNRTKSDTSYPMVSFSGRAPSFLKRYESMPYKQYLAAPSTAIKETISLKITNLSSETLQTRYRYVVDQAGGPQSFSWDGGICALASFAQNGYQQCNNECGAKHACPEVASLFALEFGQDSASFLIRHYISDALESPNLIDSLVYRQGFYNYFAYDDGTPEAGYSIQPNGAFVAMQFNMIVPDTLYAVQMLFNRTNDENTSKYFDLMVWTDRNGQPGDVIYRKIRQHPEYKDVRYGFTTYVLDEPLALNGNFYVGFMRESGTVSYGFDRVNDSRKYLFYNTDGVWTNSQIEGTLMIRAVTGKGSILGQPELPAKENSLRVLPNPASHQIRLEIADPGIRPATMQIFDFTGRVVMLTPYSNTLDVSQLSPGIYFISISGEHSNTLMAKFIVSR
ncbi:hypothetical protein MASR2M12_07490 [Bacteroidales bacterium]